MMTLLEQNHNIGIFNMYLMMYINTHINIHCLKTVQNSEKFKKLFKLNITYIDYNLNFKM